MAATKEASMLPTTTAPQHATQVPDWEPAAQAGQGAGNKPSIAETLRAKFDALCPPHRTYLGLKRRTFLLVLLGVILGIIALVMGLAVGLSKKRCACGVGARIPEP